MKIADLITEYKQSQKKLFGDLVKPSYRDETPIIPAEEWRKLESPTRLRKKFVFSDVEQRNRFIEDVLSYETQKGHYSTIKLSKSVVVISVKTSHIDVVTELDLEYSRDVDAIYKDIVYDETKHYRNR